MHEIITSLQPICLSILGAVLFYATSSYLKQKDKFEPQQFFITVCIGAAVGVASHIFNLQFDAAYQMLLSTGAVVAIETWAKAIYRKLFVE